MARVKTKNHTQTNKLGVAGVMMIGTSGVKKAHIVLLSGEQMISCTFVLGDSYTRFMAGESPLVYG